SPLTLPPPDRIDGLRLVLGDFLACLNDDLARPVAAGGIANVIDGNLALDFGDAAAIDNLLRIGLIERADDVGIGAVFGTHGPQKRERRKLAALVDADAQH